MGTNTYHVHIPIHSQRLLIDTIAKYVSNYGKPFEDELIARIVFGDDARYNFLVNEGTPENVYYKWKVYSLCQGDEINSWCTDPYWIFKGGSKWIPPHNLRSIDRVNYSTKAHGAKNLPTEARQLLIDKIAKISSKRSSIRDTMIYIIEHSDYALDVSNILIDSIINSEIDVSTKINRIYLLNDVLHNSSSCTKPSSWVYRNAFEKRLPEIFDHFSKITYKSGKIARGLIIEKLYTLVKIWESWSIFSTTFTKALEFTILSDHIDVIEPIKPPINLLNSLLDGRELNGCEVLLKLPQTYRKFAYKYVRLHIDQLKLTCLNFGLYNGGTNEQLLLRLASFESYCVNDNKQPSKSQLSHSGHSNIRKQTLPQHTPQQSPLNGENIASNTSYYTENVEQENQSDCIEVYRNFEESDMETMSD